MNGKGEWICSSEAKDIFGVHLNTIHRWCREGQIPCYRTVKRGPWRFKREELMEILNTVM